MIPCNSVGLTPAQPVRNDYIFDLRGYLLNSHHFVPNEIIPAACHLLSSSCSIKRFALSVVFDHFQTQQSTSQFLLHFRALHDIDMLVYLLMIHSVIYLRA